MTKRRLMLGGSIPARQKGAVGEDRKACCRRDEEPRHDRSPLTLDSWLGAVLADGQDRGLKTYARFDPVKEFSVVWLEPSCGMPMVLGGSAVCDMGFSPCIVCGVEYSVVTTTGRRSMGLRGG